MARLRQGEGSVLGYSMLTLGLAFLVAMAGAALALCAGAPVQALQRAMTWMSLPWFGGCCLACRWWSWRRAKRAAVTPAPEVSH